MHVAEKIGIIPELTLDPLPQVQPDLSVCCKTCGHCLTHRRKAIEVKGSHEHTFRNPAGYSFHLMCFADAPGCLNIGTPTLEATWFPGYAWSFALCAGCQGHLGWWYAASTEDVFVGLIATRLVRAG